MGIHSRFQYKFRASASKGHKLIGDILRESPYFKNYISHQEWPVSKVNPLWKSNREHFDWVIPSLKLIIEFHGIQHRQKTDFFHKDEKDFLAQQERDKAKELAAKEAGWAYVVVWPDTEVTDEWLIHEYKNNIIPCDIKLSDEPEESDYKKLQKQKASEYRKQQYQKFKEWKKNRDK